MKAKVSLTLDESLVAFVDSQPGATRSEKIERALCRYRDAWDDMQLRRALAGHDGNDDEAAEEAAWRGVMQEAMWRQSGAETSGPSRSRRSRNRGRR